MERVKVNGVGIDLWRRGRGRRVLFLHPGDGFAPDDPFLNGLAERCDVLTLSLPKISSVRLGLDRVTNRATICPRSLGS